MPRGSRVEHAFDRLVEAGAARIFEETGGLTTIKEKSLGAYAKSGQSRISGLIKPGDIPPRDGLYLMDIAPDGEVRFGFPNISDDAEIVEMMAPVIKIAANPEIYRRMNADMDANPGRIMEGTASVDEIGQEVYDLVLAAAARRQTCSEAMGHGELILTYKSFEPIGPACLPG